MKTRLTHVVAARPNFPKVAPVLKALDSYVLDQRLVHTGQHYDANLSNVFFKQLNIRKPDAHLGIGSASQSQQTSNAMMALENEFRENRPDGVVVYGDTNSALAAGLVASKLHIPIIHVEAGLRSFDRSMPEEVNRVVIDHIADLHLVTCKDAMENLTTEGLSQDSIRLVGNPMIDTLMASLKRTQTRSRTGIVGLPERYVVVTLHRPSNVDQAEQITEIVSAIHRVADLHPVIFPLHPRGRRALLSAGLDSHPNVRVVESLGYLEFVALIRHAWAVVTDSGGVQEETSVLGVPCFTLRENTERPVTISQGTNMLTNPQDLARDLENRLSNYLRATPTIELWDGHAGPRIAKAIVDFMSSQAFIPQVITQ